MERVQWVPGAAAQVAPAAPGALGVAPASVPRQSVHRRLGAK